MKINSIIKLILFPYILICQGVISPELSSRLNQLNNNELVPIIIEFNDDFNLEEVKEEFQQNKTPIKKRASLLCEKMTFTAKESQKEIINIIESKTQDFINLKSSWIINSLFLHASNNLISDIAFHPNVKRIDLQNTHPEIIEYFDSEDDNYQIENGTEPGIEAINVRPLWEMGYTGKGKLVFNYDTGVWAEHVAFSNRFFGNFYPMNQCWDGYFSDTPNGHVSDHGTHTLGTMAGLVAETNDTIGIAFKSYWIANDFVTSTVATLPPIEDMITSFEWALNPDNDTSTDYDVPDVINNSWRWYNDIDTFQCTGYAVQLMNVIEAAGIANIFSAGNNGPNNEGVRSPQRINSNLVNTFCVGSINANNNDYQISTFSCRGPTQCPGDGSLKIYPEVVAPGQGIRSAWGKDGYNTISGTSMASPHVSGAVLLLKEAFPYLTGSEILLALYNTASDLGNLGEDNTYGMGIIDAFAAFNYLSNNYEPVIPSFNEQDLILENVINIPSSISCDTDFIPTLSITNSTNSIINGLNIFYFDHVTNLGDSLFFETNLNPNENTEIELPISIISNYGNNEFSFRIQSVNNLIESDYHNNRKMVRYIYKPTYTTPFIESFQTGISANIWHINNSDYSRTWDTISTEGLNNNNISAYVNLYGYNPREEQKDELISPNILLNTNSPLLSFRLSYQKYNSSSKQDTLQIFISDDCGNTFNYKIFEKGGQDLSTYDVITDNYIPEGDGQWRKEDIDLSAFIEQEIMIKFVTTNLRGNNIFIDDIIIDNINNIQLIKEHMFEISIFPNPSNDIFELVFNNVHVENINIYNNLGQKILDEIQINKNLDEFIINLENQNSGIYYVKIETKHESQILKIIKN